MPQVSVILPIYRSQATLARCLEALSRQTYRDFEIIAVDSSPDNACAQIVEQFRDINYLRSGDRLLPHEAGNRGIAQAQGDVLAFTDPDSYAHADWLEQLVRGSQDSEGACVGAVACFGRRWLDLGAHLCKFDKWLPMRGTRRLREGPTVNLLLSRELLHRAGGHFRSGVHGDTDLCWRLGDIGVEIRSVPDAIVEHHHLHTWRSLLAERYARGAGYAELRLAWESTGLLVLCLRLMATLLPLRLTTQLCRVARNAVCARMGGSFLRTWPLVIAGLYSGLMGEGRVILRHILHRASLPDR